MAVKGFTIAQMRSVVIFKTNAPTTAATADRDAVLTGGLNDSYSTLLTTRGRLRKKSGGRGLALGLIADAQGYELICRFQSNLENNLRVDTKIDILNGRYTINTWEKIDEIAHIYKFDLNFERQFAVNSTPITDGTYGPATVGVFKLTKIMASGSAIVSDADLTPAAGLTLTVLSVSRSGIAYSEGSVTPGNLEYVYTSGQITFALAGDPIGEVVVIVYKLD